jgi:hypothetical protein
MALGLLALAVGGCQQKTDLDRCVDEKMAEYDRLYPGTKAADREIARDGHRIFCEIRARRSRP